MYRYSVDNAVTYSAEDFVLFRESPFACWMERLTLENPDHGIPADAGSLPPGDRTQRQDDIAETLRAEGKFVSLVDWDDEEPRRRAATLDAMRRGADFIVNGQLALGPLSGPANLLMRTSGYSELGDYLYIPCDTQAGDNPHAAFRLCFLADLLHSLQGQLPPQMLIIRGGDDLVSLATDEHIYHYRAVKQRFMEEMRHFRKHRMPDPSQSAHFGRWSDCANEVIKQRLLREELPDDQIPEGVADSGEDERYAEPLRQVVGVGLAPEPSPYDLDEIGRDAPQASRQATTDAAEGQTLVEQARMLAPGTYKPGPGQYRYRTLAAVAGPTRTRGLPAGRPRAVPGDGDRAPLRAVPADPAHNRRATDAALQNLEFIGSSRQAPEIGTDAGDPAVEQLPVNVTAEAPGAPPSQALPVAEPRPRQHSTVDMDSAHPVSPPTALSTAPAGFQGEETELPRPLWNETEAPAGSPWDELPVEYVDDADYSRKFDNFPDYRPLDTRGESEDEPGLAEDELPPDKTFSNALITSPDYNS